MTKVIDLIRASETEFSRLKRNYLKLCELIRDEFASLPVFRESGTVE